MNDILEYKGYHTRVLFFAETRTLRGKIEGISDFVDFETADPNEVEKEFHMAVDDYLEFCKEVGKTPEKEYKGTFNVRISPESHKKIALLAFRDNCSLNAEVEKAIISYIENYSLSAYPNIANNRMYTEEYEMGQPKIENDKTVDLNKVVNISGYRNVQFSEVTTS